MKVCKSDVGHTGRHQARIPAIEASLLIRQTRMADGEKIDTDKERQEGEGPPPRSVGHTGRPDGAAAPNGSPRGYALMAKEGGRRTTNDTPHAAVAKGPRRQERTWPHHRMGRIQKIIAVSFIMTNRYKNDPGSDEIAAAFHNGGRAAATRAAPSPIENAPGNSRSCTQGTLEHESTHAHTDGECQCIHPHRRRPHGPASAGMDAHFLF